MTATERYEVRVIERERRNRTVARRFEVWQVMDGHEMYRDEFRSQELAEAWIDMLSEGC